MFIDELMVVVGVVDSDDDVEEHESPLLDDERFTTWCPSKHSMY